MNRDEILNMPAGREMDYEIQRIVFGDLVLVIGASYSISIDSQPKKVWYEDDPRYTESKIPNYSTDISAAWQVVESDIFNHFNVDRTDDRSEKWYANCYCVIKRHGDSVFADIAPLAICRAALLAVLEKGN